MTSPATRSSERNEARISARISANRSSTRAKSLGSAETSSWSSPKPVEQVVGRGRS